MRNDLTKEQLANSATGNTLLGFEANGEPALYYLSGVTGFSDSVTRTAIVSSIGVMNLDFNSKYQKRFESVATGITGNFTITFSNSTNIEVFTLDLKLNGTIAITVPSSVVMQQSDSRFNNSTKILTLVGASEQFELSFTNSGSLYRLKVSDKYYTS